jgi:hypothetical protein
MAIPAVNPTYSGANAPTKTAEVMVTGPGDGQQTVYRGFGTATLDGSLTAFDVNWVDGTQTIPFTPTGVIVFRNGGTAAATISVLSATITSSTKMNLTISAAGSNGNTLAFSFIVLK